MVLEAVVMDSKDEEIFRLQRMLIESNSRLHKKLCDEVKVSHEEWVGLSEIEKKDAEIFRLQQLLYAADARIEELEYIVMDRDYDGKGISTGANHNEPVLAEEEKSYRRGYSQGFALCRQYIELASKRGIAFDRMSRNLMTCESEIFRWRGKAANWSRGKIVKAEWPPNPLRMLPKSA